jgi:deoxyribodipyrimidine photo-lyase
VFNPASQGQKFDPDGEYVRHWVPEMGAVPAAFIHTPHRMPLAIQQQIGCVIGRDYPAPIVDHSVQRERVLALYGAART